MLQVVFTLNAMVPRNFHLARLIVQKIPHDKNLFKTEFSWDSILASFSVFQLPLNKPRYATGFAFRQWDVFWRGCCCVDGGCCSPLAYWIGASCRWIYFSASFRPWHSRRVEFPRHCESDWRIFKRLTFKKCFFLNEMTFFVFTLIFNFVVYLKVDFLVDFF